MEIFKKTFLFFGQILFFLFLISNQTIADNYARQISFSNYSAKKLRQFAVNDCLEVPQEFILQQNLSFPFNPTTKLKYSIPKIIKNNSSIVNLKVYDVLGKEIATLVNEEKPPGKYVVESDAKNFASGIYIYRLISMNLSISKKILLLK